MLSKADTQRVFDIANRAISVAEENNIKLDRVRTFIAVGMAHEKNPLELDSLLKADNLNFIHDLFGILNHIDLNTGEMRDSFLPRFTQRGNLIEEV